MNDESGTILLVDDSRSKRYIIGSWLRRAGYLVNEARSGTEALTMLAGSDTPDAVVLDVRLPDMTGFEVCERIKGDPRWSALPVIHVSATAIHAGDRTEGLTRGADAYLVEPIDPDEMLATLTAVLRYYRARTQAERLAGRLTRLADASLAVNQAATFEGLLEASVRGAATIFSGPALASAATPDGRVIVASIDGPTDAPKSHVYPEGYRPGSPASLAPVGSTVAVHPVRVWYDAEPPWDTDTEMWLALSRTREDRPAVALAVPVAGTEVNDDRVLIQLAQAVASAVEAMRSHDQERQIALTLQRSLLPRHLPEVGGYDMAVRYLPASAYAEVGGDFYEAVRYEGSVVMAIGDVVGHSLHAATVMAELRHALRAYVAEGYPPNVVLERLNSLMIRFIPDEIATVCMLDLDPSSGRIRVANAGHLPPLLTTPDGARYVPTSGPLLGIPMPRPELVETFLPPGGTLTLFTDGLVERRGQVIDVGLDALAERATVVDDDLDVYCDRLLAGMGPVVDDDVALIAVRRR